MTALLLCMAAASALAARGAKNLVRNPGFEREAADWKFHDHAEGRSFLTIVSAARSGKKAARLTLKGPAKGRNGCLEQYFARKDLGGRRYRFSLWASSDAPVQYQMACVLELPAKTRHWIKPAEWREGWTHHATTFETQANTTALAVDFYIRHEGTLLIDDVSLRRYKGPLKRETAKPGAISKESGALAVPKRDREWRRSTAFFKKHPRAIDFQQRGDRLLFANRKIGLEFRQAPEGFRIRRLYSIERDRDHLVVDPS
jgi:hypothetical protein